MVLTFTRAKTKRDMATNHSLNACLTAQYKLAFLVFNGAIRRVLQVATPTIPLQLIRIWTYLIYNTKNPRLQGLFVIEIVV